MVSHIWQCIAKNSLSLNDEQYTWVGNLNKIFYFKLLKCQNKIIFEQLVLISRVIFKNKNSRWKKKHKIIELGLIFRQWPWEDDWF